MGDQSKKDLMNQVEELLSNSTITGNIASVLEGCWRFISESDWEERYKEPMLWIGFYIALASLVCILAMAADLMHGFRSRKLWFPCKYFKINAAFLAIISVAMKLPVDLSGSMPGTVDQVAKHSSMAFMCTMMANFMPCLATMNNSELLSNIVALCVLIITLAVNVCIQLQTGVVEDYILGIVYVTCLLWLLILHVCSSLAILKSKQIIELKYEKCHDIASEDIIQQSSAGRLLSVEMLQKHVSRHWIMAASGSPQFITACSPTASASGVICVLVSLFQVAIIAFVGIGAIKIKDYGSDYKWSMMVIFVVQSIGVVIGTIAPLFRCFATLSFKVSFKIILKQFKAFKVEGYWTWKLYDWKNASIHEFRSRKLEVIIDTFKRLFFSLCIGFQNGVVVVCKVRLRLW